MIDTEERQDPRPEDEARGATPPHGDPLAEPHREAGGAGGVDRGPSPSDEDDGATPPHGDPLR